MNIAAVVGGQYGSEGKGLIVGHIAKEYDNHVRVGAANAGHTVYTLDPAFGVGPSGEDPGPVWTKHVLQSIPCAAYANPSARLWIGPGALLNLDILEREIERWRQWGDQWDLPWKPIMIDARAQVIQERHKIAEQGSGLAERIGSTSTLAREGIGAAQAARVMRDKSCVQAGEDETLREMQAVDLVQVTDAPLGLDHQGSILLEGTQGTDLSLTTGHFPYVTSRNTTSAGLCADAGLAPTRLDRVILVCRTYPIRVAGPSGPFWPDSREITWDEIGVDERKELTTVTKKVRRAATLSLGQLRYAAMINGANEIALTFTDYIDRAIAGYNQPLPMRMIETRYPPVADMIRDIEEITHTPVTMLGTGPHSVIDIERD